MYILYPPGGHGHFLKLLLHELTGTSAKGSSSTIYDNVEYNKPLTFFTGHYLPVAINSNKIINIRIRPESYLKYFAMCVTRTMQQQVLLDNLDRHTFDQINQNRILGAFVDSLKNIAKKDHGDIEKKFIREWFRLCFFANNGASITRFIHSSVFVDSKFVVDFESFYDGSIIDNCIKLCTDMNLPISADEKIYNYLSEFKKNNLYFHIDANIDPILQAIENQNWYDLSQTNILQQAWIDNCLVNTYNIDPLLRNRYFENTLELIDEYKLEKGKV